MGAITEGHCAGRVPLQSAGGNNKGSGSIPNLTPSLTSGLDDLQSSKSPIPMRHTPTSRWRSRSCNWRDRLRIRHISSRGSAGGIQNVFRRDHVQRCVTALQSATFSAPRNSHTPWNGRASVRRPSFAGACC